MKSERNVSDRLQKTTACISSSSIQIQFSLSALTCTTHTFAICDAEIDSIIKRRSIFNGIRNFNCSAPFSFPTTSLQPATFQILAKTEQYFDLCRFYVFTWNPIPHMCSLG